MLKKHAEKKSLREADVANIINQVLLALNYLHKRKVPIVHRDLKPENVMIDIEKQPNGEQKFVCKLIDFGCASFMEKGKGLTLCLGSEHYMAPEMLRNIENESQYDSKVDIWSLGVMTYRILTDDFPFEGKPNLIG